MANSDKNIKITPNISASGQPNIVYTGSGNVPIALKVLDDSYGTLSFEGSAGQLFSLNNNLSSGTIFSVNDISGMPQFDVNADGTIRVAPYGSGVYMGGVGGGTFTIQPSAKSSSGAGTSVAITAGNGVTSGAGGSLILQAGIQATTGGDGKVVVKQTTGQTSNLQEWQNSSGSVLSYLDSNGSIYIGTNVTRSTPHIYLVGQGTSSGLVIGDGGSQIFSLYRDSNNISTFSGNMRTQFILKHSAGSNLSSNTQALLFSLQNNGIGSSYTDQDCIAINPPTFTGSAVTLTNASTFFVNGSPVGSGATITNPVALKVATGYAAAKGIIVKGAASQTANLQEWQDSSGTALVSIDANGRIKTTASYQKSNPQAIGDASGGFSFSSGNTYFNSNGNSLAAIYNAAGFFVSSGLYIGIASGAADATGGDTNLYRDAAGTFAQRNGTNAQTFRIYNTYTDASNYERLGITWASNICTIGLAQAGTGSVRSLVIAGANATSGAGGDVTITAGNGSGTGAGGNLILQAGLQATSGGDGKVVVKQVTGQTSNLQEWQNSSSTTRAYIVLSGNSSKMELGQSAAGGTTDKNGITLDSSPNGTGKPTIRLFSSGEVDAQITTSTASFSFNVGASFSGSVSSTGGLSGTSCTAQSSTTPLFRIWKTGSHFFDFDSSVANTLNIKNTSGNTITQWKEGTASVKLTVIGQSGQTANLQEWQAASSAILTSIGPSGSINLLPYGTSSGNTNEIRFNELAANGTDYVGFKAPDSISTPKIWTLPSGDGTTGQALITNGSGLLSWGTIANLSSYTNTSAATTSAYDLGTSNFVKANPSTSGLTINGFSSSGSYDGRMLKLVNVSNYNINIINTGTTVCVGGNNIVLGPKDGADLILDSGASVWRVF